MKKITWKSVLVFVVILLVGVFFTWAAYTNVRRQEIQEAQLKFHDQIYDYSFALKQRFIRMQIFMEGIRGLFNASETVSAQEWAAYISSMDLTEDFPSIRFISFVQLVEEAQKDAFIQQMRANGKADFKIWPEGVRKAYLPIIYVMPEAYQKWVGFDIEADAEILQKLKTGGYVFSTSEIALSSYQLKKGYITLWIDLKNARAQSSLPGWAAAVVDFNAVVDYVAQGMQFSEINLQIFSEAGTNPDQLLIARMAAPDATPLFSETVKFEFGGKEWTLLFTSGPGFKVIVHFQSALVLLGMSLLALLLIASFYYLLRDKDQVVEGIVKSQAKLETDLLLQRATLDSAQYAMISMDAAGIIVFFNKAAERLLGYQAQEVVGVANPILFHDPDEMQQRAKELSDLLGKSVSPGFDVFITLAKKGISDEKEWTYVRKDKSKVRVILCITAVKNPADQIIGYVGIAREK